MTAIEPTISTDDAAKTEWDAVVIGAGPAGTIAARALALRHARVLLVDKARFPRDKVCGGCLNNAGLSLLEQGGLTDAFRNLRGRPTRTLLLACKERRAAIPLPMGLALSRRVLDAALLRAAIDAGVHFIDGTRAELIDSTAAQREVRLADTTLRTKTAIIADGLASSSLRGCPQFHSAVARGSRIGAGAIVAPVNPREYPSGTIHMACGRGGYVGVVRIEDDKLNVAAAFDRRFLRDAGGPAHAARDIILSAGLPDLENLARADWHGTAMLTVHRRPVAHDRVFLIGDAAEYVEPFTGEGMAWAIASGLAVAPLAMEAAAGWRPELADEWIRIHRRLIHRRAARCRTLTLLLRHNWLTAPAVHILARLPALARPLTREVVAPFLLGR